jgi:hypothetical protein
VRLVAVPPNTGTLRGDLMKLAEVCTKHAQEHASTIRAVLVETSRHPALSDAMQHEFLDQRKALIDYVLRQAVERGEIAEAAISEELWDLLPNYLVFRAIIPGRAPTRKTIQALVDDFIMPGLTRTIG